jgi:hypothetical protein
LEGTVGLVVAERQEEPPRQAALRAQSRRLLKLYARAGEEAPVILRALASSLPEAALPPLARREDRLLIVPRLSALSRLPEMEREVDHALADADLVGAIRWIHKPGGES